jgi:hypothetical protein
MELQYVAELEKRGLQVKNLPEDAQTGIKEINKALSFIKMGEAKGKKTSPDAIKKIKAMDKWVLYEIYDMESGEDENEDEIPYESDDVKDDLDDTEIDSEDEDEDDQEFGEDYKEKNKVVNNSNSNSDGPKIEAELAAMYKSGKQEWTIDEIRNTGKSTYNAIFEIYSEGEQNGVKTTNYSLLEIEKQKYKLTKI